MAARPIVTAGAWSLAATGIALAAAGASVVASGSTAASLDETVGPLETAGGTAVGVTDSNRLQNLVRESIARFGRLDIAVNNTGILRGAVPAGEVSGEDWDAVIHLASAGPTVGTDLVVDSGSSA